MILGLGADLVAIGRVARAIGRHGGRFEARVYTDGERAYCRSRNPPEERFAGRFAAKEAVLKALRVPRGWRWRDVEIARRPDGAPEVRLGGAVARAARELRVARWHLTITHGQIDDRSGRGAGFAMAVAIAEGEGT